MEVKLNETDNKSLQEKEKEAIIGHLSEEMGALVKKHAAEMEKRIYGQVMVFIQNNCVNRATFNQLKNQVTGLAAPRPGQPGPATPPGGTWRAKLDVKVAHIVPWFLNGEKIGPLLFGSRGDDLEGPANSLVLANTIKNWFDKYLVVVIPVSLAQPIRRWKTELVSNSILNTAWSKQPDGTASVGRELDGKELKFRSENRPASRFLSFHFVMSLVRMKDLGRPEWEKYWAKYYGTKPFPTPGNHVRKSMLVALATHFNTTDMGVVETCISDQGFEDPTLLSSEETRAVAKEVHEAVEDAVRKTEEIERGEDVDCQDEIWDSQTQFPLIQECQIYNIKKGDMSPYSQVDIKYKM
ncbi:hypothetical protein GGS20DRAFT_585620 [Poronia punctata]|nr:hypothetical protein GGS20DRAFT_585620 [Poronia punctata]